MLQFALKNFIKYRSPPDFSVDKIKETPNKNIGYGHKIDDSVIHPFGLAIVCFALKGGPAHGTLRLSHFRKENEQQ